MTTRRSPLAGAHLELGAKMVPFGGWEMPLSYPGGTVSEHLACRSRAAAFDVSHLGTVRVEGHDALDRLQETLTNDLARVEPGRAQYSHLLDDSDGSVLDDVIVWWVERDRFEVMPNASNTVRVESALGGVDVTGERAVIAVQGPEARKVLAGVAPEAGTVPRFSVRRFAWRGSSCLAAGTGYTGEDGVECAMPLPVAEDFWWALIRSGVTPAGLGARDTLRLEAGFPLHGHELGPGITPLQAGLGWVVGWAKPRFRGRAALERERDRGVARTLRGIVADGRRPPRQLNEVSAAGRRVGVMTSGNFSPVLRRGIGLALLEAGVADGTAVSVETPGAPIAGDVVPTPFVGRRAGAARGSTSTTSA